MKIKLVYLIGSLLGVLISANSAVAQATTPLLQPGKTTIYQRVLVTPDCKLVAKAGDEQGKALTPFLRLYVYAKQENGGKNWLQVGTDIQGTTIGWLDQSCTVAWNMQLSLAFTNPTGRDKLLFFKDKDTLQNILAALDPQAQVKEIRDNLAQNKTNPLIVSQEPDEFVDFKNNFYLLPILDNAEIMDDQGQYRRLLKIASVTKTDKKASSSKSDEPDKLQSYKAAVVFVIDTTISMQPYIDKTKQIVDKIYKDIEAEGLQEQIKFGLVAYRNNTAKTPKLEYTSKIFVDPNEVKSGKDFMNKVKDLRQADVSSASISEDTYAGMDDAINNINWQDFSGRYIILITDAGALDGSSGTSSTNLNASQIRTMAQDRGIAIYTLYLRTPFAKRTGNDKTAEQQYKELSFNKYINKPLFYQTEIAKTGNADGFGKVIDQLSSFLVKQVSLGYKGEVSVGSAALATKKSDSELEQDAALVGRAMYLAYLGEKKGSKAPSFFEAWISDRDFANPNIATTDVYILLTKSQLSDLRDAVKKIIESANKGITSPSDMFNQLKSVAAAMGRDPNKLKGDASLNIAKLGLLGEYLDDVPYKSDITGIDEESWKNMSIQQQEKLIRTLERKLKYYQKINADADGWIDLAEKANPRDAVKPVPLEQLP